jgi:hypothetical protein
MFISINWIVEKLTIHNQTAHRGNPLQDAVFAAMWKVSMSPSAPVPTFGIHATVNSGTANKTITNFNIYTVLVISKAG